MTLSYTVAEQDSQCPLLLQIQCFSLYNMQLLSCLKTPEWKAWISFCMENALETIKCHRTIRGLKYIINYSSFKTLIFTFCHLIRIALPCLGWKLFCTIPIPFEWRACCYSSYWKCCQQTAFRDAPAAVSPSPGHTLPGATHIQWLIDGGVWRLGHLGLPLDTLKGHSGSRDLVGLGHVCCGACILDCSSLTPSADVNPKALPTNVLWANHLLSLLPGGLGLWW